MPQLAIALVFLMALLGLAPAPAGAADDGKQIFLKSECNECHTVKQLGIEKLPAKEGGKQSDEEAEEEDEDTEPPDLSGVGKEHDAKFLAGFLQKKVKNDDGKKHRKRFKGSDAELQALVAFLGTLQTPVEPSGGK